MSNGEYYLTVDGAQVPLRKVDTLQFVTPAEDEDQDAVAARLEAAPEVTVDPDFPPDVLAVRGSAQELDQLRAAADIENTRAAFEDPEGNVLLLTNDILVGFEKGVGDNEREAVLDKYPGQVIERKERFWKFRVSDPADDAPLVLANQIAAEDAVRYAEPNALQAAKPLLLPQNEPRFGNQWHLRNQGGGGGVNGAHVDALGAWAVTTGNANVRVVVHDSGVDLGHPDLAPNIDPGWDFDNNDNNATPPNDNAHGTACAGVIAAAITGQGVVGIAPGCRIVPLRAAGAHTYETWAETFDWAAQHGDIISCSWSITANNTLSDAIRDAVNGGAAVFCATANDAAASISYPASLPETIAVGASTNQDVLAGYSNTGVGIDFVAPSSGGTRRIETTDIRGAGGYNTNAGAAGDFCLASNASGFGGTSSATPLAAGIAALMLSVDGGLTPASLRALLRGSAAKIDAANAGYDGAGWSQRYGYGRLNAAVAVRRAVPPRRVVDNFAYDAGSWRVERHPRFLADVTGDGCDDVVGFGNAGVWISRCNGNGTFQAPQMVVDNFAYNAGSWRVERHPRFLADLTGDRRADIVGFGNAGVWVSLNNGNGTFKAPALAVDNFAYDAGGWRVERHPRMLGDLTGDKRADIVGFGNAGVWVSLNNGNGTFKAPQLVVDNFAYNAGGWRVENHPRVLADTTGDGRADIVGFGNAGVWVSRNKGDGTFHAPQMVVDNFAYNAGGWRVEKHPRMVVDLTGDGRADIIGFGNAGVWVSRNNGDGTFQAPQMVVANFAFDAGGWRVERHPRFLADVTGDGRPDIVGFGNGGVWVSRNNGNGTFRAPEMVVANFGYNAGGWRVEKHPRELARVNGNGGADVVGFGNAGVWVKADLGY